MEDIIFITIAAVICGGETWNDIENYGKSKESWLRQYLQLPNGIPSHDTFNRFFSALDPESFEQAFIRWVKDVAQIVSPYEAIILLNINNMVVKKFAVFNRFL